MPMFSVQPVDSWIEDGYPLRAMANLVDSVLERMSEDCDAVYSEAGRPSIPPEHLLNALLIQVLYSIRSERQLVEHLRFNLLTRGMRRSLHMRCSPRLPMPSIPPCVSYPWPVTRLLDNAIVTPNINSPRFQRT